MSPNSSRTRRQTPTAVASLFSRPYWYEGRLLGDPRLTFDAEFAAPAAFEQALREALGTFASSDWIARASLLVALELLEEPMLAMPTLPAANAGWTVMAPAPLTRPLAHQSNIAHVAEQVRGISGLTVAQLAALFPQRGAPEGRMSRENFHRWLSGKTVPGDSNLQRLLALRHLFSEASWRVADVRSWLFSPLSGESPDTTPYEVLRRGALTRLWPVIAAIPVPGPHSAVVDSEVRQAFELTRACGAMTHRLPRTKSTTPATGLTELHGLSSLAARRIDLLGAS